MEERIAAEMEESPEERVRHFPWVERAARRATAREELDLGVGTISRRKKIRKCKFVDDVAMQGCNSNDSTEES